MSSSDLILMDLLIKYPNEYWVVIDNDSVWVEKKLPPCDDIELVGSFDNYGYEFIRDLFRYFNIKADFC